MRQRVKDENKVPAVVGLKVNNPETESNCLHGCSLRSDTRSVDFILVKTFRTVAELSFHFICKIQRLK